MQIYTKFSNFAPMRYLHILILCLVLLTGCGNDEEFVINCEIRGLGSTGVEMYYTTRSLQHSAFHPVDGKVTLRGVAADPTLVEVFTMDNEPLFACVVSNGDHINVKMDLENPSTLKIKGNDASEQLGSFVAANDSLLRSGDVAAINRLVADVVRDYPDRISSAALLVTRFCARGYELEADSLINILKPSARANWVMGAYPGLVGEQVSSAARGNVRSMTIQTGRYEGRDTMIHYWPSNQSYSLIVVTGQGKGDSVRSVLKDLTAKLPLRRFKALEIAAMGDSSSWAASVGRDSAEWIQAWLAGGVAAPVINSLQIPSVPFFIVADSTGKQIYRGFSVKVAQDTITKRLAQFMKEDKDSVGGDEKPVVAPATPEAKPVPAKQSSAAPSAAKPASVNRSALRRRVELPDGDRPERVTDNKIKTVKKADEKAIN